MIVSDAKMTSGREPLPWIEGAENVTDEPTMKHAGGCPGLAQSAVVEQSGEAIERMAKLAAEASGAEIVSGDDYDLTLVDLPRILVSPALQR